MAANKKVFYIVEPAEWSTKWDGKYITENIKKLYNIPISILGVSKYRISRIQNQILHFGSRGTYLPHNFRYVNKSNNIIFTWFHGTDADTEYIKLLPIISKKLNVIHTSCSITKNQLINWGTEENIIKVSPLGVDTQLFNSANIKRKALIRKKLRIPESAICVGSFQKDGNGWGAGNTPKLIKGPDVFCEVIQRLKKKYPVFVLLTGPARGYVKNRLSSDRIPFKHYYLRNYLNIVRFYQALDFYLISSRAEGGPKALIESFATGIPVVSTDVGMVHDIAKHKYNALISKIDDTDSLVNNCEMIIGGNNLREKMILNGLETVKKYDWKLISERYYKEIYSRYL